MADEPSTSRRWYRAWNWRPEATGPAGRGPAGYAEVRLAGAVGAALRLGIALVGGVAALLDLAPPARAAWVVPAVALSCAWAVLFGVVALRDGLRTPLLLGELALTSALCLAQFCWPARIGVPAGLAVTAAYLAGAAPAGLPDHGLTQTAIYVVQVGSA